MTNIIEFPTKPEITASPANRRKLIERARFSISARDKTKVLLDGGWIKKEEQCVVTFSHLEIMNGEQLFLDDAFEIEILRGLDKMGVVV